MDINIGDRFIINYKKICETYINVKPCLFPDKVFTIMGFSKSNFSVYYADNRTTRKCSCHICSQKTKVKSIGRDDIIIVETKTQRERDLKLKSLNI